MTSIDCCLRLVKTFSVCVNLCRCIYHVCCGITFFKVHFGSFRRSRLGRKLMGDSLVTLTKCVINPANAILIKIFSYLIMLIEPMKQSCVKVCMIMWTILTIWNVIWWPCGSVPSTYQVTDWSRVHVLECLWFDTLGIRYGDELFTYWYIYI